MTSYYDNEERILEIYKHLNSIVQKSNEPLEGNCYTYHCTLDEYPELIAKRENIFNAAKEVFDEKGECEIGEVGFNAGHSALLLIMGSEGKANYTFYDLDAHTYAKPCFYSLQACFPDSSLKYIPGDSKLTLKEASDIGKRYDLFHLDGGHNSDIYYSDLRNVLKMVNTGGVIIIDDTDTAYINKSIDDLIEHQIIENMDHKPTTGYPHRIVRKL